MSYNEGKRRLLTEFEINNSNSLIPDIFECVNYVNSMTSIRKHINLIDFESIDVLDQSELVREIADSESHEGSKIVYTDFSSTVIINEDFKSSDFYFSRFKSIVDGCFEDDDCESVLIFNLASSIEEDWNEVLALLSYYSYSIINDQIDVYIIVDYSTSEMLGDKIKPLEDGANCVFSVKYEGEKTFVESMVSRNIMIDSDFVNIIKNRKNNNGTV